VRLVRDRVAHPADRRRLAQVGVADRVAGGQDAPLDRAAAAGRDDLVDADVWWMIWSKLTRAYLTHAYPLRSAG
jgi:hypothetical protein